MYEDVAKKLKQLIRILMLVGYAVADIVGVCAGIWAGSLLKVFGKGILLQVVGGLAVAGIVAGILLLIVWFTNTVLYLYADMSENMQQIRETLVKNL